MLSKKEGKVSRKADSIFENTEKKVSKKRKATLVTCAVICLLCIALDIYFLIQIF